MTYFSYTKPKMLVADEGYHLRGINDVYEPEHTDEEGNVIPEHFPHYSTTVFIPDSITEEEAKELYIEEKIED